MNVKILPGGKNCGWELTKSSFPFSLARGESKKREGLGENTQGKETFTGKRSIAFSSPTNVRRALHSEISRKDLSSNRSHFSSHLPLQTRPLLVLFHSFFPCTAKTALAMFVFCPLLTLFHVQLWQVINKRCHDDGNVIRTNWYFLQRKNKLGLFWHKGIVLVRRTRNLIRYQIFYKIRLLSVT